MNLSDYNTIKTILTKHGFTFSKALGQNFLVNPQVCPDMADSCGIRKNTGVLEIGPGIGVLTKELAERAEKVVAVELDTRLLPVLAETLAGYDNVRVINDDVLKIDLEKLIEEELPGMNVVVCANLPYYITSPVIMTLLEKELNISAITVMIQKEVADRICAEPGSRDSGAITIAVNYYARAEKLFQVGKGSFMPVPKVDSTVIRLDLLKKPPVEIEDKEFFFAMVKAAFSMRRKTALNGISNGMGISKDIIAQAIENAGFDITVRVEKLDLSQLAKLSSEIKKLI